MFGYSDVFNAHYILNHEGVMKWGRWFVLKANMIEVTPELLDQYPLLREQNGFFKGYSAAHSRSVSCNLFSYWFLGFMVAFDDV